MKSAHPPLWVHAHFYPQQNQSISAKSPKSCRKSVQEILAFAFGMVQSTANEWIQLLSEVLKRALDHGGYLPERDPKQLETVLASETESTYGIDGTERPRQRPQDPEKQKHYYSGKKNAHGQESRYWWHPYAQSQLLEPNL